MMDEQRKAEIHDIVDRATDNPRDGNPANHFLYDNAKQIGQELLAALEAAEARANGMKVAIDTMFEWMSENGIEIEIGGETPVMFNRAAEKLAKLVVLYEKKKQYKVRIEMFDLAEQILQGGE